MVQERLDQPPLQPDQAQGGIYIDIDGENVFIPDEDFGDLAAAGATAQPAAPNTIRDHEIAMGLQQPEQPLGDFPAAAGATNENIMHDHELALALDNRAVTADDCLQRILEIFPDISHEHVLKLYNDFGQEGDYETLPGQARLDNIIEQLVSAPTYPKQEKGKLKRKREPSIDESDTKKWEQQDRVPVPSFLTGSMRSMLKAEFGEVPVQFLNDTLKTHQHFYQAYVAIAKAKDSNDGKSTRLFGKGRPSANLATADTIVMNCGWPELAEELRAARTKVKVIKAEKAVEEAKNRAEKENLEKAIAAGETSECSACFEDLPMNRQIHCNGPVAHFTCYDCALMYVKTEVGESRCRVLCTAGCGAGFALDQLNQLSDKQLLEKLAQLQQEKDIRDAGLDDLEECPFCDYKAILPPIDEDFELRCANPECEKVSCRRCKSVSHVPISCEQHAKENKINSRHKIEEAMTAALIRSCNQCKKTFIKEYGCNKMRCPSCGNMQCYVCSISLKDYNHFDQSLSGTAQGSKVKCPLYDNVEERHEREVREAEAAARAQVVSENPDVSVDDLEIKVSDAVKKATADRIRQAGGPAGVDFGVQGGLFQHFQGEANVLARERIAANRERQQAARRAAVQARMAAHHQLGNAQAQAQALQARLAEIEAQGQRLGAAHGLGDPVQGYIPVFWHPPAAAQAPQGQQGFAVAPQQPQARRGVFDPPGELNLNMGNPFMGPGFGNDGAADLHRPLQLNRGLVYQAPPNNNNNIGANPGLPNRFPNVNPPNPVAMPTPHQNMADAEAIVRQHPYVRDYEMQMQMLELQNMRRVHDQQLLQTQQMNRMQQAQQHNQMRQAAAAAHAHNRQQNPHYADYEEEMRRQGFPPGR
jgi:TRIAD3 protein (E3 ubiquitin-protein ligase RNF216)